MELIGIERTTVTSLFVVGNQKTYPGIFDLTNGIAKRYEFAEYPRTIEEINSSKAHFGFGKFDGVGIDLLDVYSDGVFVQARSNSLIIDEFLDDVLDWAKAKHGLRPITTESVPKSYSSTLLVKSDAALLSPFEGLEPIQSLISGNLKSSSGRDVSYQPYGWSMSADSANVPGNLKPIPFRIERKVGAAFEKNLYVTEAPLQTDQHLDVLVELEKLVT